MKVIIGLILLVSSVFGDVEFYETYAGKALIHVTELNPSTSKTFTLEVSRDNDRTIAPSAFNGSHIREIIIKGKDYSSGGRNNDPPGTFVTLYGNSFAGIENLKALTFSHINLMFVVGEDPFAPLLSLNVLNFRAVNLSQVPTRVFSCVPRIQWLSLKGNRIHVIESSTFIDVPKLQYLDLSYNNIKYLEPGAFDGLTILKELILSHNNIAELPHMFQGTYQLRVVNLEESFTREVTQLRPGMFDDLHFLTHLNLKGNHFESIPMGMFNAVKSLKFLDVSFNNLSTIPPRTFGRSKLDELHLQGNRIEAIESDTFSGALVRRLHLAANGLAKLEPRAFNGLMMEELDLKVNRLTEIGIDDFDGCSTKRLDLSFNEIMIIADGAFSNTVTEELQLEGNPVAGTVNYSDLGLEVDMNLTVGEV